MIKTSEIIYYLFSSSIFAAIFAEFSAPLGTKFFENSFKLSSKSS
jgi:hypothetical protein